MSKYAINEETLTSIADGVRWRTNSPDEMTPAEMVSELKKSYFINLSEGVDIMPYSGPWVRPQGWPDLDSLNLEMSGDTDFIYMTYDADREYSAINWHIETTDESPATLDIGHITNGEYIADETFTVNHGDNFVRWTDDYNYSGYLVIRITGSLKYCFANSCTHPENGRTQNHRSQPILERIAYVPHLAGFCAGYNTNAWTMYSLRREKVANGDGNALNSLYYAWAYGYHIQDLDISGIRTQNVTSMNSAICYCLCLRELDLRHFNVAKVTTFATLFSNCRSLQRLDLRGWNTSKATTMASTFASCYSLIEILGLDSFITSSVTSMGSMFNACYSLRNIPVENFNISKVTSLSGMFNDCRSVESLDLSNWRPVKVTNISTMFNGCWSLKYLNLDGWTTTGVLTSVAQSFANCRSLEKLDVSWLHVTSACTSIYSAFTYCLSLKELDIPNDWDLSGIDSGSSTANSMFSYCYSLERITGISNWQFSFSNSLASMFQYCYSLKTLDVSGWKVDTVTSIASMFNSCYGLESLDLRSWHPDNSTSFASVFESCWNLKELKGVENWNTSNATSFTNMFNNCRSLQEIPDISGWDFSKATGISSMFGTMFGVVEADIRNLDLRNCTTIATLFRYCFNLRKVTLTGWQFSNKLTAAGGILRDCYALEDVTIDLQIPLEQHYGNDMSLTHESLINIINSLPSVNTTRIIYLQGVVLTRLSNDEIAIATQKGWTVTEA